MQMERGAPDADLNDAQFSDYASRVKYLAAVSSDAAAAANQRNAETFSAQSWMGNEWGDEEQESYSDSSGSESEGSRSEDSTGDGSPSLEGVDIAKIGAERNTGRSQAKTSRPGDGSRVPHVNGVITRSETEELFGDNNLAPPSFGAPAAVAAAELAAAEASKDELLEELVGLAAALKGEARALNSHLVDQNKDLDKLTTVAELTSTQLGGEVRKLHAHFRRRLVAACGGLGMLMAVVFSFAAAVLFMRFFPKRWSVWSALMPLPADHEEL